MTSADCSADGAVLLHREAKAGHDGGADAARYRQSHQPRDDDVAEDGPVHVLPCTEPADEHHRADLAVRSADWHADVGRHQHRQCRADLDTKTTATNNCVRLEG